MEGTERTMKRALLGTLMAAGLVAGSILPASAQWYGGTVPGGSYQQSCTNASVNGTVLSASCRNDAGQWAYSSIDVRQCSGGGIANYNGRLACENGYGNYGYGNGGNYSGRRGGRRHDNDDDDDNRGNRGNGWGYGNQYGYGVLPSGSYQQSCVNLSMRGTMLSGACTAMNGRRIYSSIEVRRCESSGRDIRNDDGRLRC